MIEANIFWIWQIFSFFETDGEKIFGHTKDEAYEVKQKLYELEELLRLPLSNFQIDDC